jgi:hypothetical protein
MAENLSDKIQEIHQRLQSVDNELEQQQQVVTGKLNQHQGGQPVSLFIY